MYAAIIGSMISTCEQNIYGNDAIDLGDDFIYPTDKVPIAVNDHIEWADIQIDQNDSPFSISMKETINQI